MAELDVTRGNYTLAVVPALIVVVGACLQPETTVCASGMRCPGGQVCDSIHLLCVFPDQLASCQGEADGDRSTALGGEGECDREVCLLSICGDGVVGPQEVCDDGPLAEGAAPEDGDGCSADCRSDETWTASSDIFALGSAPGIYHFDGAEWTPVRSNGQYNYLEATAAMAHFVDGADGLHSLIRLRP